MDFGNDFRLKVLTVLLVREDTHHNFSFDVHLISKHTAPSKQSLPQIQKAPPNWRRTNEMGCFVRKKLAAWTRWLERNSVG